jgi:hypothetical protein
MSSNAAAGKKQKKKKAPRENWFRKMSTEVLSVFDIAGLAAEEAEDSVEAESEQVEVESVEAFVKEQKARRENLFRRVSAQLSSAVTFDAEAEELPEIEEEEDVIKTLHIIAHRAEALPSTQMIGSQDPYVSLSLVSSNATSKNAMLGIRNKRTSACDSGDAAPKWVESDGANNHVAFELREEDEEDDELVLLIEVWNENMISDDFIAGCDMKLADMSSECVSVTAAEETPTKTYELTVPGGSAEGAAKPKLFVQIYYTEGRDGSTLEREEKRADETGSMFRRLSTQVGKAFEAEEEPKPEVEAPASNGANGKPKKKKKKEKRENWFRKMSTDVLSVFDVAEETEKL